MARKIIRKDFVARLQANGLTAAQAEAALDTVLLEFANAFQAMERVELRGFGTLTPKVRLGGKKRNPRTGETIFTSDVRVVKVKLSKELQKL